MKPVRLFGASLLALGLMAGTAASTFAGPGDITYRQKVMGAVGGHMGAMSTIIKGQGGDMKHFAMHADAMAALARMSQTVFPKDSSSMEGKTDALDAIWEKPEHFAKVRADFVVYADKLAAAAKSGDKGAMAAAIGELGKNGCKACHTDYKKKD